VAVPAFDVFAVDTASICTVTGAPLAGIMLLESECGALYRPVEEIVPVVVDPPESPFTCQVTAVVACPLIVAENCVVVKTSTVAALGMTATGPAAWAVSVTVAEADFAVFSTDVAVTVTVPLAGIVAGAMYVAGAPLAVLAGAIVPHPGEHAAPPCVRVQVAPFILSVTVAVNF